MNMWNSFWAWYERTYALNVAVATALFLVQLGHLVWLTGEVVWPGIFGTPLFVLSEFWKVLIAAVDYTEIPALISVSLIYLNELRKGWNIKDALFLFLLNTQWFHLLWITDEIVVETLTSHTLIAFPVWLAWAAIIIDYFELPVMFDTTRKFIRSLKV